MNIVILGSPGSGKGTQAKLIAKEYNITHISTGDLFREILKKNCPLKNKIKKYVDRGLLVPNEIVVKVVKHKIQQENSKRGRMHESTAGFLLDGFPRNKFQAETFDKYLEKNNSQIDLAIFLKVNKKISQKRLQARRICPKCLKNYNLITDPPKVDELCNLCKIKLKQRIDDTSTVIAQRLKIYDQEIQPIVNYYRSKKKLVTVEANKSIEEIFQNITHLIKNFTKCQKKDTLN
ncbi:MAG: nucleoside monophosphate kinase [Elusimicrobiota bacterium]|nr:nucleoside monophosphate kinase [Elusimicrobiota bacterium]